MIPKSLALDISTPDKPIVHDEVDEVQLPGYNGALGVLPGHAPLLALLNPGELCDCERALQRVAAARIEKDDDRRTPVKKFFEGDPVTILILENSFVYLLSAMTRITRPGDLAQKAGW